MPSNLPRNSPVTCSSGLGLNAPCDGVLTLARPTSELAFAALWCAWNKLTFWLKTAFHSLQVSSPESQPQILPWAISVDSLLCLVWSLNQVLEIWVWAHARRSQRNRISLLE